MRTEDKMLPARREAGIPKMAGHVLLTAWNPQPIEKPTVDSELPSYPFLVRSVEVLKYQMLLLEYSLSQGGGLRAWIKLNLLCALLLAIPVILVVPVVTALLSGVASWSAFLHEIMWNFTMTLLLVIICVGIVVSIIFLFGKFRLAGRIAREQQEAATNRTKTRQ